MSDRYDTLVVGAGYAGSVMAERLASEAGHRVLVIDRRDHIAGNAHDYYDEHGVLCHQYGPHIFHTNSQKVVDYLSRFTDWRPYEHRVLARVDGKLVPMPINRTTVNELYGLGLTSEEDMERFLESRAEAVDYIRTSEDVVVAKVGRELYEKFFRGYTRKQWQRDPSELHSSVCARIPIRTNVDDRYFTDSFQKIPVDGYTAMFERILDHPLIEVSVATDYWEMKDEIEYDQLVYTGPVDKFFDYRFGPLPYSAVSGGLVGNPLDGVEQQTEVIWEEQLASAREQAFAAFDRLRLTQDPTVPTYLPASQAALDRARTPACSSAFQRCWRSWARAPKAATLPAPTPRQTTIAAARTGSHLDGARTAGKIVRAARTIVKRLQRYGWTDGGPRPV